VHWDADPDPGGARTQTGVVVAQSDAPLWGGSFWSTNIGTGLREAWAVVAAGSVIAVYPTLQTAFLMASLLQRPGETTGAAIELRNAVTGKPDGWHIGIDDPTLTDPATVVWPVGLDGWARPWSDPGDHGHDPFAPRR